VRRVLFSFRGITVRSYPALLYVGLVCGFYVMYALAPSMGMRRSPAAIGALILFVPALVGSRVWYVLDHWTTYRRQPAHIWRRSEGGMTLYGGLVLSLVLSPGILAALGVRFAAFWDAAMFTILVGMIFTRIGCLLNGCCSGRRSEGRIALRLPDHTGQWERRYPVQLLELSAAALLLAGSAGLLALGAPRGTIFAFGLVGYGSVRLGLDRLREPSPSACASHRAALAAFLACSLAASAVGWLTTAS
jgi:phosphatidylglycerol---prolipoprotein diacylglyceryl transferase